jgi:hypothetical protein
MVGNATQFYVHIGSSKALLQCNAIQEIKIESDLKSSYIKKKIFQICLNYHIEFNPSDAGSQDSYVV